MNTTLMNDIPYEFWMVIVGSVTFFICMILYYLAMLLREGTGAVSDARVTIQKANLIVDDAHDIVSSTKGAVKAVTEPVKKIGGYLNAATGVVDGFMESEED